MPSTGYIAKLVTDVDHRTTGVKLKPGVQFCSAKENRCPGESERQRKKLKRLSSPLSEVQMSSAGDQAMPDPFVQNLEGSRDREDDQLREISKDEMTMGDEKASKKLSALPCMMLFHWFRGPAAHPDVVHGQMSSKRERGRSWTRWDRHRVRAGDRLLQ